MYSKLLHHNDIYELKELESYYVNQIRSTQSQYGGLFPVFKEYTPYQSGGFMPLNPSLLLYYLLKNRNQTGDGFGSFFKGLFRAVLPMVKSMGKSALKTVGKQALHTGTDILKDISLGQSLKESAESRLNEAGDNLTAKIKAKADKIMSGSGRRKRKPKINKRSVFNKKLLSLITNPKRTHVIRKRRKKVKIDKWI